MLDFKYHITSIVAVFLALALGILLGSVIVDKGIIAEQQQALINSVKADVKQIQEENRSLKKELDDANQLQGGIFPLVVQERLSQKNIVFISSSLVSDTLKETLSESVEKAGAKSLHIRISAISVLDDPKKKSRLASFFPEENLSDDELKSKLIEEIAVELATPSNKTLLKELIDLEILEMKGDGSLPANGFVFIGADLSKFDPEIIDLPLIGKLKEFGLPLVAVEVEKVSNSSIPLYQNAGISTVDNVDALSGRVSLVYTLRGVFGNFGVKPSAEKLLPIGISK
ncbi:copper transporter [Candidatus Oleimmundimicrobium sp.]|uniref:copper transporter n=1 Tax=Candidatus Oleimmundimicrobium sp. TaxID=3060597 RepID=UPI00271F5019|nr:copper transporter [Candidatus Oleimmundimicrobium sp.]MDO8886528.1 copper transporter [Candidatus Oleimmundimicrobium sp.]